MPFRIRALQVDGGSEFKAAFEQACKAARGAAVRPAPALASSSMGGSSGPTRTHTEEFYEVTDADLAVGPL